MSRLLYEKHVPADPLLAPLFAQMPPGQPQRLADWLGGALGGPDPPRPTAGRGPCSAWTPAEFGEDQRARWVALAGAAADQARLPADAGFRAALSSCLEWLSRSALAADAADAAAAATVAVPRWDWGPAGPPAPHAATHGHRAGLRRAARAGRAGGIRGAHQAAVPGPATGSP